MCVGPKKIPRESDAGVLLGLGVGISTTFTLLGIFFAIPVSIIYGLYAAPLSTALVVTLYYFFCMDGAERNGEGRPWPYFSQNFPLTAAGRKYFNFTMTVHPKLRESRDQHIIAIHPHGVMSDFRLQLDGVVHNYLPNLKSWRALAASVLFKLPVMREMALWTHCIDASRTTAERALAKGHSLFIVVGGEREQILGSFGTEVVYVKKRLGFIRLALSNGVSVVPSYCFGVTDAYRTSRFLHDFRYWLVCKAQVAIPIFWGRWGLPCPYPVRTSMVLGEPLVFSTPKHKQADISSSKGGSKGGTNGSGGSRWQPTEEEVTKAHQQFVDALTKLFDEHKERFGYGERELVIC